jgi:hypothetical protein
MWARKINGKYYHFEVYWKPDSHASDRDCLYRLWKLYAIVYVNNEGYLHHEIKLFDGYPTNGVDKSRKPDTLPLPYMLRTGIVSEEHLKSRIAHYRGERKAALRKMQELQADWDSNHE